jgi:sulfofructose kinase
MAACGGGPAANASVTVARLGGTAAFAGYLGEDVYGNRHYDELASEGVRTELVVRGTLDTPLSMILVKPDGRRTVVNHRVSPGRLGPDSIDLSCCRPKAVLFDGHEPEVSVKLAREARKRGIPTLLDAGSVHEGTQALAPLVDYLAASLWFAADFTSESDPHAALSKLRAVAPFALITLGQDGVIWGVGRNTDTMPAFPVDPVDTTGAGDAFHGALALCVARGEPIHRCLRTAAACGALCCTRLGARIGIPRHGELKEFLSKHGGDAPFA